jgi:hypothetical protein
LRFGDLPNLKIIGPMISANHSRQLHMLQKEIIIILIVITIIIFKIIFSLECMSAHPMDNSCEDSLQSD